MNPTLGTFTDVSLKGPGRTTELTAFGGIGSFDEGFENAAEFEAAVPPGVYILTVDRGGPEGRSCARLLL